MTRKRTGRKEQLGLAELFPECSRAELELIDRFSTPTDVRTGTALCREGEVAQSFYVIAKGTAAVEVDGNEVATLGPGCGFGEVALLRGGRRTATVTATSPMAVFVFSRPEFDALVADVPAVARDVLRASAQRLTKASSDLTATL